MAASRILLSWQWGECWSPLTLPETVDDGIEMVRMFGSDDRTRVNPRMLRRQARKTGLFFSAKFQAWQGMYWH